MVEGLVQAIDPGDFIVPQKPGRRIRSTRDPDTFQSQNPVDKYIRNNDRCYRVPETNTDQYRHSYFPNTSINTLGGTWEKEGSFQPIAELRSAEPNSKDEGRTLSLRHQSAK